VGKNMTFMQDVLEMVNQYNPHGYDYAKVFGKTSDQTIWQKVSEENQIQKKRIQEERTQ
jgi:hypothetical protein